MLATDFLDKHRPHMLELAAGATVKLLGNPAVKAYLDALHRDFEAVTDKPNKRPSLPGEDVFWWCVTILEELTEVRGLGKPQDPYVLMMLDQLRSMHARLEANDTLPPEYTIHWFDDEGETDPELEAAIAELDWEDE